MTATRSSAFTTTMRVISCVHNDTADRWANTLAAITTSFTNLDVLMLLVTNGTDACCAHSVDHTYFATWQLYLYVVFVFCHELCARTCTTHGGTSAACPPRSRSSSPSGAYSRTSRSSPRWIRCRSAFFVPETDPPQPGAICTYVLRSMGFGGLKWREYHAESVNEEAAESGGPPPAGGGI